MAFNPRRVKDGLIRARRIWNGRPFLTGWGVLKVVFVVDDDCGVQRHTLLLKKAIYTANIVGVYYLPDCRMKQFLPIPQSIHVLNRRGISLGGDRALLIRVFYNQHLQPAPGSNSSDCEQIYWRKLIYIIHELVRQMSFLIPNQFLKGGGGKLLLARMCVLCARQKNHTAAVKVEVSIGPFLII